MRPIMNKFAIFVITAILAMLQGCDQKSMPNLLASGPDATVNDFRKEVDKGNVVTVRQYLSPTFNGLPKDDERITEAFLASAKIAQQRGGVDYPVTGDGCQILGETAKCPYVLRYKDKSPPAMNSADLVKIDGKWLLRGITKSSGATQ